MFKTYQSNRVTNAERSDQGFTLIELLVVLTVIAILVSLLLPALNKVRAQANVVVCLSNMRQIGVGMTIYIVDNSGYLPRGRWDTAPDAAEHGTRWLVRLASHYRLDGGKYTGGNWTYINRTVLVCPADRVSLDRGYLRDSTWVGASYFGNGRIIAFSDPATGSSNRRMSQVGSPSRRILMTEKEGYWFGNLDRGVTSHSWSKNIFRNSNVQIDGVWVLGNMFGKQHKTKINVLMADFSAGTWEWDRMNASVEDHNASKATQPDWWYWRG